MSSRQADEVAASLPALNIPHSLLPSHPLSLTPLSLTTHHVPHTLLAFPSNSLPPYHNASPPYPSYPLPHILPLTSHPLLPPLTSSHPTLFPPSPSPPHTSHCTSFLTSSRQTLLPLPHILTLHTLLPLPQILTLDTLLPLPHILTS